VGEHGSPTGARRQPRDVDQAMKVIAGTARSMGVEVDQ
jgi:ribosomal protein L11